MIFENRTEAGRKLAEKLIKFKGQDVIVFALPRGGVPVAAEVAKGLESPLDLIITRKIGHPFNPEYAMAAVTENGYLTLNKDEAVNATEDWFVESLEKAENEARRERKLYFGKIPRLSATGKIAIIVDDGLATGLTMETAIQDLKRQKPSQIIIAVPLGPVDTIELITKDVNEIIVVEIPEIYLGAVGSYYHEFNQISDEEVINILNQFRKRKNGLQTKS